LFDFITVFLGGISFIYTRFRYTYDAPNPDGVTHCGLYVGDGMMLHCGDPVQFTSLNTSYWQSHFYAWGRLP
jgi:cell wall-associated NlpC family hydrolase